MVMLVIFNIILIVLLLCLIFFFFKNSKSNYKDICVNDNKSCEIEIPKSDNKNRKGNISSERVFVGRFVSEEEYQQMNKNKKSEVSILMEELNREYEHLKELSK